MLQMDRGRFVKVAWKILGKKIVTSVKRVVNSIYATVVQSVETDTYFAELKVNQSITLTR